MGNWRKHRRSWGRGFEQNHGIAGVVYILENQGLAAGYFKIGCSRRSGHARAFDLNADANTGTPGTFRCIFEHRTLDCGRAEQLVFRRLAPQRRGKRGQEFFEVELGVAERTIIEACAEIDRSVPREPVVAPAPTPPNPYAPPTRPAQTSVAASILSSSPQQAEARGGGGGKWWLFGIGALVAIYWLNKPSPVPAKAFVAAKPVSITPAVVQPRFEPIAPSPAAPMTARPATPPGPASSSSPDPSPQRPPILEPRAPLAQDRRPLEPATPVRTLTRDERQSIEAVCSSAKYQLGPSEYRACVQRHEASVADTTPPDTSRLSRSELSSINSVCSQAKYTQGPLAYDNCLERHLRSLQPGLPLDMSGLTREEQSSLEAACSSAKYTNGPAAYNECRRRQLSALEGQPRPDLSTLSRTERQSAEAACSSAKYTQGPSAYNKCLMIKVGELESVPQVDITGLSRSELQSIESVCSTEKYTRGPAAYRACMSRHVAKLR